MLITGHGALPIALHAVCEKVWRGLRGGIENWCLPQFVERCQLALHAVCEKAWRGSRGGIENWCLSQFVERYP